MRALERFEELTNGTAVAFIKFQKQVPNHKERKRFKYEHGHGCRQTLLAGEKICSESKFVIRVSKGGL